MRDDKQRRPTTHDKLIALRHSSTHPAPRLLAALANRLVAGPLAIEPINAIYDALLNAQSSDLPFCRILRLLDVTYQVTSGDLAKIPDQGPLVVIANHPFGGIEGIVLGDLLQRIRRCVDARIRNRE